VERTEGERWRLEWDGLVRDCALGSRLVFDEGWKRARVQEWTGDGQTATEASGETTFCRAGQGCQWGVWEGWDGCKDKPNKNHTVFRHPRDLFMTVERGEVWSATSQNCIVHSELLRDLRSVKHITNHDK
jgi:hypothetical protein